MKPIPQPRLVVMGTLDERLDRNLLISIAEQKPEWQLVLIGRMRSTHQRFAPLIEKSNVHFLDKQPVAELPALLNGADVTLIPYALTEMTRFISPLKAYEYLASGKPIVSVALPEVRTLQPWVKIIESHEQPREEFQKAFIRAIETALETDSLELQAIRRQAAWQHTWQARAALMQATIEALNKGKKDA